ncbi:MAG: ATP phosphoribosyltransferase regulatory subunit, partial [Flavobacteriales bacterium]|nr:ATP phosphoribosyltransferase regulatory subunit [Flavobacteriales bacterium]
ILSGLAEVTGQADLLVDMTVALDKLDKIGEEAVVAEMKERGLTEHSIEVIRPFMQVKNEEDMWTLLDKTMQDSETGRKGIEELRFIFDKVRGVGLRSARLELDLTLARGLNYYTGAIFEVKAHGVQIGSIGGGGRYDDLTGIFGMKNVSGVGVSFGLDRIYLALEELGLFAGNVDEGVQLIFANMGENEALYSVKALKELRAAGIKAEIYPDAVKLGRQMDYANKKSIPYVAIAGSSEVEKGVFTLKNMNEGTQSEVRLEELLEILKK